MSGVVPKVWERLELSLRCGMSEEITVKKLPQKSNRAKLREPRT